MTSTICRDFVTYGLLLIFAAFAPTNAKAQEPEKERPGTTVESWRRSLPAEAEARVPGEETPSVATSSPANEETRKTLLSLEQLWMDSLKAADADSLSQIIAGDFTFTSPRVVEMKDRNKYLEYAIHELKLTHCEIENITVRVFGRTAIVTALLSQKATMKGKDGTGKYLVTDVWIFSKGTWRAVSRHESPLEGPDTRNTINGNGN